MDTDMNATNDLATILAAKDEITLDEYNAFINENKIRNNFVPIMDHLRKLTKEFTIDECCDPVTKETSSVTFSTKIEKSDHTVSIGGQVGYDQFDKDAKEKNLMSYDIWWDEENYAHFYTHIQMRNWLSHLFDRIKIPDDVSSIHRYIRNQENLIPLV